jgi:hypothetical protein
VNIDVDGGREKVGQGTLEENLLVKGMVLVKGRGAALTPSPTAGNMQRG